MLYDVYGELKISSSRQDFVVQSSYTREQKRKRKRFSIHELNQYTLADIKHITSMPATGASHKINTTARNHIKGGLTKKADIKS